MKTYAEKNAATLFVFSDSANSPDVEPWVGEHAGPKAMPKKKSVTNRSRNALKETVPKERPWKAGEAIWPREKGIDFVSMGLDTFENTAKSTRASFEVERRVNNCMYGKSDKYDVNGDK